MCQSQILLKTLTLTLRRGDISNKDEVKRLAEEVASKESKGIHLLVNNGESPLGPSTGSR